MGNNAKKNAQEEYLKKMFIEGNEENIDDLQVKSEVYTKTISNAPSFTNSLEYLSVDLEMLPLGIFYQNGIKIKTKGDYKKLIPAINKTATFFFKHFDQLNNTNGILEYYIPELNYFIDYINFDLKLILEWDEPYHKNQKELDMNRQKEIMNLYPDFIFKRIEQ